MFDDIFDNVFAIVMEYINKGITPEQRNIFSAHFDQNVVPREDNLNIIRSESMSDSTLTCLLMDAEQVLNTVLSLIEDNDNIRFGKFIETGEERESKNPDKPWQNYYHNFSVPIGYFDGNQLVLPTISIDHTKEEE